MITRRDWLKGVSLGAGGVVFSPLIRSLAAQVEGKYQRPKRVVFILFDNGFHEPGAQPAGVPLEGETRRELPLGPLTLPKDIDPFAPYKDRMLILQGLRGEHVSPSHGAGFGALTGMPGGGGEEKYGRVLAESIDAALARLEPGIFPILALGVDPGRPQTSTVYCSSAWGPGRAIPVQCRPELAYESLFGSTGATRNEFVTRSNLLDFVAEDVKGLRKRLAGPEQQQLEYHLSALESLSRRNRLLDSLESKGELARHAPKRPAAPPQLMPEILTAQFDIAAAALTTGLTRAVTLSSGLCRILTLPYSGFSNLGVHSAGHNEEDPELKMSGFQILAMIRRFLAERTVELMKKLQAIPEDGGTMLDNTLIVFTSDSANWQHSDGKNWPFVLIGNLGGRLKTGRLVCYPMKTYARSVSKHTSSEKYLLGIAPPTNPTINALYCTLLHAAGAPREHFNLTGSNKEADKPGPLRELLY